jgi:hypothetical protein
VSKLRGAVEAVENRVSGKFGSLGNKLLKLGKKSIKKPKHEGVKRGFSKIITRQRSKVEIVAERTGGTVVNEDTNVEVLDCLDVEPEPEPKPSSDVLEVWFPGCHTGKYARIFLIPS